MSTGNLKKPKTVIAGLLIFMISLMVIPSISQAEVMSICPFKIIMNAQGQFDNIQAVIRTPMVSGYTLEDYHVTLKFNGIPIIDAYDFRYCYVDDNFLASFDRPAIQAHPEVIALTNTTVCATVEGWYTAVNGDGETYTREFSYDDMVEIIDPDKSQKDVNQPAMR